MSWLSETGKRRARSASTPSGGDGYTLLELLIVMAVLALLIGIAAPQALKYLGRAKTDAARVQIDALATNLDLFRLDVGRYPAQAEGLQALIAPPQGVDLWAGPYVTKPKSLIDPWGRNYVYRNPGQHGEYDLFTLGSDGSEGGDGEATDIKSWE